VKQCVHCDRPARHLRDDYYASDCKQNSEVWRKYGVTCVEYNFKKFAQNYTCANEGCNNPAQHLDHNHETGQVRDFLCSGCNKALGYLGEDFQRMAGLIKYLAEHETSN